MESDPSGTADGDSPLNALAVNAEDVIRGTGQLADAAGSLANSAGHVGAAGAHFGVAAADLAIVAEEGTRAVAKAAARAALNAAANAVTTLSHKKVLESLETLPPGHGIQSHHIIQSKAVEDLPGYDYFEALTIPLQGPSSDRSTAHGVTRYVQRQRGGGNFLAEVRIGYKTLRRAGLDVAEARGHIQNAIVYFRGIGVHPTTPTKLPLDRR